MSFSAYFFSYIFGTEFTQKWYFLLYSVTVYSKCPFLVHCCCFKLRIWVVLGITEIQCSYYLNKFACRFHSRLPFSVTIGGSQLRFNSDYLCSSGKEKNILVGGRKAGSWTCVLHPAENSGHRTFGCLGILYSSALSLFIFPSLKSCDIIFSEKSRLA